MPKYMRNLVQWKMIILCSVTLIAAAGTTVRAGATASTDAASRAVAVLHPTEGSRVAGTVIFTRVAGGVQISATLEGLAPGKHGFHIHERGDCTAPDGTSAGGHYNPDGHPHAGPDAKVRHMGDLGNLEADQNGRATYERRDDYVTLNGAKSIIGRAVVVHAAEDDLNTQPTGNAGGRLACGVIGLSK
jgi:Cu-Zn family superoxide dismutase